MPSKLDLTKKCQLENGNTILRVGTNLCPLKQFVMILPANRLLTINTQSVWMMHWIYITLHCCSKVLWVYGWITAVTILSAATFFVFVNGNCYKQSQCRINSWASQSNSLHCRFESVSVFRKELIFLLVDQSWLIKTSTPLCDWLQCVQRFIGSYWHKMSWHM